LKQNIKPREVHKFISDLLSQKPLIVVVIDKRTKELDEALRLIGEDVQVVEFRTFRREGLSDDINAYMFEPVVTREIIVPSKVVPATLPKQPQKLPAIMQSVFELFDDKGVDKVTYHQFESVAGKAEPDTKFSKMHFSLYKNKYKRKRQE